ncbi:hypothetical protein [Aliagarivorans taiwanensis]|uniref:hypothetical protein n=1 Tax=Aliagarivorans taiwanensis TaxID=561966 RepID=UPI00047925ED|nr:hypothetical protein [Aliagarivorans taiwanensis]
MSLKSAVLLPLTVMLAMPSTSSATDALGAAWQQAYQELQQNQEAMYQPGGSCSDPQQARQDKMDKFSLPSFPSLLEDCGFDGIFDSGGGFDIFGSIFDGIGGVFCGYTTKDIGGWFGYDLPDFVDDGLDYGHQFDYRLLDVDTNGSWRIFDVQYQDKTGY